MGDVAMTVPVVRALSQQYPDVKITMVSRPFFKPFFDGIPNVDFFAVDVKKRHKGFLGLLTLYSDLKKLKINAVADLHNVLRSQIITTLFKLSGTRVATTDKGREEKKQLTRLDSNKTIVPLLSMFERHVQTFTHLGFPLNNISTIIFPAKQELSESTVAITGFKSEKKWIGIAPFAQYETKVYPFDLMQQVVKLLAGYPYKVFLFGGGAEEIVLLEQLKQSNSNSVVIAGKLSFKEELQLISNLDVMLSMDSGNGHIAAMFGVKVISIWGATHPYAGFIPFNQPLTNSLLPDRTQFPLLPTSVYGNKVVKGYENAMRNITPESIVEKIATVAI